MTDTNLLLASMSLLGIAMLVAAILRGWQGWLAFKTRELDLRRAQGHSDSGSAEGLARIEIADLKERIRKLEAIASGVEM